MERDDDFRMPAHAKRALSIQSNSMTSIASNFLLDCLAILLELLGKDEKLISPLPAILFFRHPLLSFPPHPFAGLLFCSVDLRLQPSLLFQGATCHTFLHLFQGEIVIVEFRLLRLSRRRVSLR
jgi:hypothetical protein